ncbi:pPIWI_RE module domain-containing protein [Oceanobacillus massiliensis]|uniref:pPIWI_RE module domain-containing protein n=1 Tax=Oceanobacillus massiliensis TaxID=1465765 RepID=UPI00028A222A|nr:DUF3962 domain-containing protein [Oceanobacillus massiliensis]
MKKRNYNTDSIEVFAIPIKEESIEGYAVYFPKALRELLQVKKPKHFYMSPVRSLHETIKIMFSDFLFFNSNAEKFLNQPWLFFRAPFDIEWLKEMIQSWYKVHFNEELPASILNDLSIQKEKRIVDITINEAGNPIMKDFFTFQYLPKHYADKIKNPLFVESLGKSLNFIPIQSDHKGELVSWPPERYERNEKKYYFSYKITFSLQTVPFSETPQMYLHIGLVRWKTDGNVVTRNRRLTVYIRGKFPWIVGNEDKLPFVPAKIKRVKTEGKYTYFWDQKIDQVIEGMNIPARISSLTELEKDAESIFEGINDSNRFSVSIPYSTQLFGYHPISDGAGFKERYEIAKAAANEIGLTGNFLNYPRVAGASKVYSKGLELSLPKNFTIYMYYSSKEWLEKAEEAILQNLKVEKNENSTYQLNDALFQIKPIRISENLFVDESNKMELLNRIEKMVAPTISVSGCLFELHDKEQFKSWIDPKDYIRYLFAKNDILTQFITPDNPNDSDKKFEKGTLDLFRQMGILSYRAMGLISETTQYIGFLYIEKNKKTSKDKIGFPVMVRVCASGVMMAIPNEGWVSYSEGLLLLTKHAEKYSRNYSKQDINKFIYSLLAELEGEHIILFTHSQNSRRVLPSLNNTNLQADNFEPMRNNLSIVRIRDQKDNETPEWCAYRHESEGYSAGSIPESLPTGVYQLNYRVFFSIAGKSTTQSQMNPNRTKLESPNSLFHKPVAIEVAVPVYHKDFSPIELAKITHDLRKNTSIQYDKDMTNFPLPLHLALKAKEYAFTI